MATNNVDWSPTYPQPTAAISAALMANGIATGRTMVAPIVPPQTLPAIPPLPGIPIPPPRAGTVLGTFIASDIVDPYATVPVGLIANYPVLPSRYFGVLGAPLFSNLDVSFRVVFMVPANISAQNIAVQVGLCTHSNANNLDVSGNPAAFGLSIAPLVSGTSTADDSVFVGEYVSATAVLPTAPSTYYQCTMFAGGSISPGNIHVLRLTRKAGSLPALDKNQGDLLLISLIILSV